MGVTDMQRTQLGQAAKRGQTDVPHAGSIEIERLETFQAAEVTHARVANRRFAQLEHLELRKASQVGERSVGERCAVQVQHLEFGQAAQIGKVVVADRPAIEADASEGMDVLRPELLTEPAHERMLVPLWRRAGRVVLVIVRDEAPEPMRLLDHSLLPPGPVGDPREYAREHCNKEHRDTGPTRQPVLRSIGHRGGLPGSVKGFRIRRSARKPASINLSKPARNFQRRFRPGQGGTEPSR